MKPTILTMIPIFRPQLAALLEPHYRIIGPYKDPVRELAASGAAGEVRAVVTTGPAGLSRAVIEALPHLEIIAVYGSGYENVDVAAAKARGIPVTTGRGGNAASVADRAIALLLASVLRVLDGDRLVRSGEWDSVLPKGFSPPQGFSGCKLGVLGLGQIGEKIARRAESFDLEIAYHGRKPVARVDYRYVTNLAALAEWADFLVVSCELTPQTHHMVNREVLKALGPNGYLVNIARGAIVDEAALIAALRAGEIAGAGLDSFETEPEVPGELRALPNVVLSPHVAGATESSLQEIDRMLIGNLSARFAGKPLLTRLDLS